MITEDGKWIMYGVEETDPECIHTAEELIEYIEEVGFLPLFQNDIPGFSVEERTVSKYWWSDDPVRDPWLWREVIARSGRVAYGKFFDKKAGFISKEWFPVFANYRRDGYDFDALWDDEKAPRRHKKIMDLFCTEDTELYSYEIKEKGGFGKGKEAGYEGAIAALQMETYLCAIDFRHKKNKQGQEYGMAVAVYAKPEHNWGYEYVTSAYKEDPVESGMRIVNHMLEEYGIAKPEQIKKLLGSRPGEATERVVKEKKINYPVNLFQELGIEGIKLPNNDQLIGLEFVYGNLTDREEEIVKLRYEKGMAFKRISELIGVSAGRCGEICREAVAKMKSNEMKAWIIEGYSGHSGKS